MMTRCPHCRTKVVPGPDGTCPACRKDTWDTPEAFPTASAPRLRSGVLPSRFPVSPFALALVASVALGAALFLASRVFYVYIAYNWFIGAVIGAALARAPARHGYTDRRILFGAAGLYSFSSYVVFNVCLYLLFLSRSDEPVSFLQFLWLRGSYEPFIGGAEIGLAGNIGVWIIEYVITLVVACRRAGEAVRKYLAATKSSTASGKESCSSERRLPGRA